MVRALFGGFAALQTFFFLARRDRFAVLFWWTGETWAWVLLLWLKNLALAAAAGFLAARLLGLVTEAAAREEEHREAPLRPAVEASCAIFALALGAALRWIFLAWNPPGLWVDVVYAARPLFGGASVPPWGATPFGELETGRELVSNLYVAFVHGIFALFGSGETGFFAISALPGCLALPALWWLAREAFGPRTALTAAFCGALLGWPLLLARWTSTAVLLVALVCVAAAATLVALRTGRLAFAALSGAGVGLSLHTHASAGAVAGGFLVFALLAAREKRARRPVAVAAVAAVLVFAPLAWAFLARPGGIGGHLRDVHLGTPVKDAEAPRAPGAFRIPVVLAVNALDYTGVLLWTRDPNPRHAAGRGLVTAPFGIAMLLGLGLAASRRCPADVLLLLLAAGSLLAGILSNPGSAPNTLRVSALVAPAALLAAVVLETGIARAVRAGMASRGSLLAGLAAALFALEALPALVDFPARPGVGASFCAAETEAGRMLARLPAAPVVLVRGAVRFPAVVEAVAHGADLSLPLGLYARKSVAEIRAAPPGRRFWVLASPSSLAELCAGGLACGRGIAPAGDAPGLLLARVKPRG